MESDYAQQYRRLYLHHWWWRSRERYILHLIANLRLPDQANILDIGCGDALFFDHLSKFGKPFGIEPDVSLLTDTPWRNQIWNVPFDNNFDPNRQFDLILMLDVLEHLDHDQNALQYAKQWLKPAGKMIVTVPALNALWTSHDTANHHRRRYTRTALKTLFQSADIHLSFCNYYFIWTAVPKFLMHMKERAGSASTGHVQTIIPSKWINVFLTSISYYEHRLFHALPMPFGSSLIAIGEK